MLIKIFMRLSIVTVRQSPNGPMFSPVQCLPISIPCQRHGGTGLYMQNEVRTPPRIECNLIRLLESPIVCMRRQFLPPSPAAAAVSTGVPSCTLFYHCSLQNVKKSDRVIDDSDDISRGSKRTAGKGNFFPKSDSALYLFRKPRTSPGGAEHIRIVECSQHVTIIHH